jgi:hypothetical protein
MIRNMEESYGSLKMFIYSFETTTNMPRHNCLDSPVEPQDVQQNASLGYCPVHRHPLYVEFIESLSVLLISILRKALDAVDLPSDRASVQKDMTIPPRLIPFPGESQPRRMGLDLLFDRLVVEPLDKLTIGKARWLDWDDDGNATGQDNLICQGGLRLVPYLLCRLPPG